MDNCDQQHFKFWLSICESLFVDVDAHNGLNHTAEFSHIFKAVPFEVISSLWGNN